MKIARQDRTLIAWMLYASILFSLFACAVHHGQGVGLQLSGLDTAFCSTHGDAPVHDSGNALMANFQCPLCSAMVLGMALLFGLAWLLRREIKPPRPDRSTCGRLPPRYLWPSANPRASPLI